MPEITPTYLCSENAIQEAIDFCVSHSFDHFTLVSDVNTYAVLGGRVEQAFKAQGWRVNVIVLQGREIIADMPTLAYVIDQSGDDPGVFLAVGSGTITDITRFSSHKKQSVFISLPTAPSVDGFASSGAPIITNNNKVTVPCHAPLAIFADLNTLCHAPKPMIAAGFGDMLGKFTSLADWKLAHLITDEPFNPEIASRVANAVQICVDHADAIGQANTEGILGLMNGLVESGNCMALNGNSRPASGSEHHLSHFWELMLLRQGRPAILHGTKVGIGTILVARRWRQIRYLSTNEVEKRLEQARVPDPETERANIEAAFQPEPQEILQEQERYLSISDAGLENIKQKIVANWGNIQLIAAGVPLADELLLLLKKVSAPSHVTEIGLNSQDEANALHFAHYLRSQFTVTKLGRLLGLWE